MGAPTLNRMIDNRPKAETAATSAAAISLLLRSVSYSSASLQALQCGLSPDTLHPDLHSIFDYLDDIVRSQTCRLVEAVTDQVRPALTVRTIHGSAIVCHRVDKRSVERTWNVLSISSPCRYWLCRRQRHIARMCRWKRVSSTYPDDQRTLCSKGANADNRSFVNVSNLRCVAEMGPPQPLVLRGYRALFKPGERQ